MPDVIWSQDNFTKGELSPYMYARVSIEQYYAALKTAENVLTYPQGAPGKRFGTFYKVDLPSAITAENQIMFETFQYLNECVYQILVYPDNIAIYLEGVLCDTVATTGYEAVDIQTMDFTVLDDAFRIATEAFPNQPQDLNRAASANNVINSVASDIFTVNTAITDGQVLPVRFNFPGGGAMPTTVPQVREDITYFVKHQSTSTVKVYASAPDAASDTNAFTLSTAGTNANMRPQNTWTLDNLTFKNYPVYDFVGGYETYTFTPSATSGASKTLTCSTAVFYPYHVGGAFVGGGGIARITAVTAGSPSTTCTIQIQDNFDATTAISGTLSLLAEPAWSATRGWPRKVSSYQSRSMFANTDSLPNGVWLSAINDYTDYNDLASDDDDAISWFPSSNQINYIKHIVPYRSLTVHTNSGVFSTPLSFETAITPSNFSLNLQDSTPAGSVKPRSLDNQIFIISGNDVTNLVWDGVNNAYDSGIVSLMNEQVVRSPVDEASFVDLSRAGSRYLFVVNAAGTMAIYQSLISQDVSGWTINFPSQSYGNSYFRRAASSLDGRCWFVTEREIAEAGTPIAITAYTSSTLTATASAFSTSLATAVQFTTTGTLPSSTPALAVSTYYWVIGVDADTFNVYASKADAEAATNAFVFTDAGTNSNEVPWAGAQKFMMEELTFDTYLDCATHYTGTDFTSIPSVARFNAQDVKINGDGYGFEGTGIGDAVAISAHGAAVEVSDAYVGFPIEMKIETLPLSMTVGNGPKNQNLAQPKRIRDAKFMFNNTIGGTINGVAIALNDFDEAGIGTPPVPSRGIFEMSVMNGWDDFKNPAFTIYHDDPFNIELLGIFYTVDF